MAAESQSNSLNVRDALEQSAEAISRQLSRSERVREETRQYLEGTIRPETNLSTNISGSSPIASGLDSATNPPINSDGSSNLILKLPKLRKCQQPYCICSCHKLRCLRTPSFLNQILGSLFTGYIGVPKLLRSCDTSTCGLHSPAKGHLFYIFPKWFVKMAVFIQMELSQVKGPELLIRCIYVREFSTTPSFQALAQYQFDQVKSLISTGRASIRDVTEDGKSMFHVSSLCLMCFPV